MFDQLSHSYTRHAVFTPDNQPPKIWLLLAGEFYPPTIPIRSDDVIIAVDNGIRHIDALEEYAGRTLLVDYWIGDFDGLAENHPYKEKYATRFPNCRIFFFPSDKEQTDFQLSLVFCQNLFPKHIINVLGGSGGEEDHYLGNLVSLIQFTHPVFFWQRYTFGIVTSPCALSVDLPLHSKFSLMASIRISGLDYHNGLRWVVQDETVEALSTYCLRNEVIDNPVCTSWTSGRGMLIFSRDWQNLEIHWKLRRSQA